MSEGGRELTNILFVGEKGGVVGQAENKSTSKWILLKTAREQDAENLFSLTLGSNFIYLSYMKRGA